jgi:tetratricopeptide (TPR) repeat protein
MLKKILKKFKKPSPQKSQTPVTAPTNPPKKEKQWTDDEYEKLFSELLSGVNDGWTKGSVKGFLAAKSVVEADLVVWLRGFGEKLLASDVVNDELLAPMMQLGELGVGKVGDVARDIGLELREKNAREEERGEAEVWFDRGCEQCERGDYLAAIDSFNKGLKLKPDSYKAWYHKGNALADLRQFTEAISSYDQAIKICSDFFLAWFMRGLALMNIEQFTEAIASYDQAIKIRSDFFLAWFMRGVTLNELKQFEKAIISCEKAIEFEPNYYEAWKLRGFALDSLGRYKEAIASYNKAIQLQPEDDQIFVNLGMAWSNLGNFKEALSCYDKAIEINPKYHKVWFYRGLALYEFKFLREALESFEQAIQMKPDFFEAWGNHGVVLDELKLSDKALKSFEQAIQLQPNSSQAWFNQGKALANLQYWEEAIASYEQATQIESDYLEAWVNWGAVLCDNLELPEGAIICFEKAIKLNSKDHNSWGNMGSALSNLGDKTKAMVCFDRAIEIKPDFHNAWYNRGKTLAQLGRLEEAIASFDKGIELKADDHQAWIDRGMAAGNSITYNSFVAFLSPIAQKNPHLNQRGYEGELASYEEGLKYCPQDTYPEGWGQLHQAIGNAHYKRGRRDSRPRSYWFKAANAYDKALKTLTKDDFPELHLEVLKDLIRVHLDLGETPKAKELQRRGTDVLRDLLKNTKSPTKQKQLALKFASFQQLTVDILAQSGNWCAALEVAEAGKNACLSWIFHDRDNDESPTWADIQNLLNPSTAIIYWHISPAALHTFILKHNASSPIILPETQLAENTELSTQTQRLIKFEEWVDTWNKNYHDSSKDDNEAAKEDNNFKVFKANLRQLLDNLKKILNLPAIVEEIEQISNKIQNIILIPHRDLHRFPIHALFPDKFTISYLPSAKIGLSVVGNAPVIEKNKYQELSLLSIEYPTSKGFDNLEFAEVESAAICQIFSQEKSENALTPKGVRSEGATIGNSQKSSKLTRYSSENATREALQTALLENHDIFHFTGHAVHNFNNPALSYLALAGEDKLTMADIHRNSLASYRLISLAACETSITASQTITTEYVGLVSGFMSCGSANVVSTLWIVESEASTLLMIYFYQLLQEGQPEVKALAEACQWLRNVRNEELVKWYEGLIIKFPHTQASLHRFLSRRLKRLKNTTEVNIQPYKHPYFWAAFTITGSKISS